MKICLQSGHWSKAGSGAPNEQATNKRITDRLSELMRERGFEVVQTDWWGFNDPVVTGQDFALFLALHCDMDYPGDNGSGFADYPDPKTDLATTESQRICKVINDNYFPEVKINYVNHSNANTRFYYMWQYLSAKTPCVLLEMGQSIDPHDSVLLGNTELIANAIGRCICKALGVSYEVVVTPPPQVETCESKLRTANNEIEGLKIALHNAEISKNEELADLRAKCNQELSSYKIKIKQDIIKLIEGY